MLLKNNAVQLYFILGRAVLFLDKIMYRLMLANIFSHRKPQSEFSDFLQKDKID